METAVRVNAADVSPAYFGELLQPAFGKVEQIVHVYDAMVRACFERDRRLALAALRLDPACARLTGRPGARAGHAVARGLPHVHQRHLFKAGE